ncbi:MAG: hypothetical protein AB8B57_15360 [Congregibacter sp.]
MLTEDGYFAGLMVYIGAALLALLLFNWWLLRGRSAALRLLLTLPLGALLLTPALIQPGADTFAPALIVVAFQWLSQGPEAAEHALRPLGLFTGSALALGVLCALVLILLRRGKQSP